MAELRRFTERHSDWMGLALSASQARQLITDGKLAVVASVEVDSLDSILGDRKRRISPREAARLQGLPEWFDFGDQPDAATYKQMGNGVNVGAVWHVLREQLERGDASRKRVVKRGSPGIDRFERGA